MNYIILKPGREKSVNRRHPWIFSGAIETLSGTPESGETISVRAANGDILALAAFSPNSKIRARIWTWNPKEEINYDFIHSRISRAISHRNQFNSLKTTNASRQVNAESDGLPGLIADRYENTVVVQFLSTGAEYWKSSIIDSLKNSTGIERIYERSDGEVRELEGLPRHKGLLWGKPLSGRLKIHEHDLHYWVDIQNGHKTGLYLDQRDNRLRIRHLAEGKDILDCFCYTGGFTMNALAGGADSVTSIDNSQNAISLGQANLTINHLASQRVEWIRANAFQILRKFRDVGRNFDMIILDPPKFAATAAQAQRASRGYKDINLLAFKLLRPGGFLVTFSCSGGISSDAFQKIISYAALDAGVEAQIIEKLTQASDHPVATNFPEGFYLKGLVVRIN